MSTKRYTNHSRSTVIVLAVAALIFLSISIVFLSIYFFTNASYTKKNSSQTINTSRATTTDSIAPVSIIYNTNAFLGVETTAKSFIVYDPLRGQIVASKDQDTVYPLASITKVMTGFVAHQVIGPTETITIKKSDLLPEGDSGLREGDIWKRDDLIAYTLSVSSNDGARALARVAGIHLSATTTDTQLQTQFFVNKMNSTAKDLGLFSMSFNNESGLDSSPTVNGGYANVFDVAKLFAKVYTSAPIVFENTTKSISYIGSSDGTNKTRNTNQTASNIPGLAASKTGFTDLALGNLGVVVEMGPGSPVVIVALHSTKERRFSDIERLRKATLESLK